jgi:hypothetical protein
MDILTAVLFINEPGLVGVKTLCRIIYFFNLSLVWTA